MILLAAALACAALAGCGGRLPPTAPTPSEAVLIAAEVALVPKKDRLEVGAAVALEVGARFRCPGALTLEVFLAARLSWDLLSRQKVGAASAQVVDRNRRATDAACGIPAPPA